MNNLIIAPLIISLATLANADAIKERTDFRGVAQVWVPAGSFMMGSTETPAEPEWAVKVYQTEKPAFKVTIAEGYWIDKYEVTMASFEKFAADNGYTTEGYWSAKGWQWISAQWLGLYPKPCFDEDKPNYPRACVSWYEAEAYANWRGGRLPTEAEWEYAARGPESRLYPWGNEWDSGSANISDQVSEVGQFPNGISWVGAYDMSGNVMEWVQDWFAWEFDRSAQPEVNPIGAADGYIKMEKGGWYGSNPEVARAAYHHFEDPPHYSDAHIGFRIVSDE